MIARLYKESVDCTKGDSIDQDRWDWYGDYILNDGPIQDIQLMLQSVTDIATRLFINSATYTDIYRLVSTSKTWKILRNDLALPTTECAGTLSEMRLLQSAIDKTVKRFCDAIIVKCKKCRKVRPLETVARVTILTGSVGGSAWGYQSLPHLHSPRACSMANKKTKLSLDSSPFCYIFGS